MGYLIHSYFNLLPVLYQIPTLIFIGNFSKHAEKGLKLQTHGAYSQTRRLKHKLA